MLNQGLKIRYLKEEKEDNGINNEINILIVN